MPNKVDILGVNVDSLTMQEAVEQVEKYIEERNPVLIATANAEMLMRATYDEELKSILNGAAMVTPDGAGTVWAAHHLGFAMPERGSAPGVAEKAKAKAENLYPGIEICGVRNGFFKESDEPAIIEEIKAAKPDILLAALGVPKQEKWLWKYKDELGVPVSIGVGGTLDVMAGVMKRAPRWMQKAKLEWLFRGMLQPKRAGRLLALPKFVLKVHASKR